MEIKNMVSLVHPGVLQVYEVFEGSANYYIVMEFLAGKSLDWHMKEK
jgi:serine/threonine protein kinase